MDTIITLVAETFLIVVTVSIAQLLMLVFRNPHRPAILHHEAPAIMISIILVVSFGVAVLAEVHGLTQANFDPLLSLILAFALIIGTGWVNWRVFGLTERLQRADAGESPF